MKPATISVAILVCLLAAGPAIAEEENPWAPKPVKEEPVKEEPVKAEPGEEAAAEPEGEEEWEEEDTAPKAPACPLVLEIETEDAYVVLDGKIVGRAPLEDPPCPAAGEHQLVVQKEGFVSVTRKFLMSEEPQTLSVTLTAIEDSGILLVVGDYPGAVLVIDGVEAGFLPWEGSVAPGSHDVTVINSKGNIIKSMKMLVLKGEKKTISVPAPVVKKSKYAKLHWGYMAGSGGLAVAGGVTMLALAVVGKKHHDEFADFREEAKAGTYEGDPVKKDEELTKKGKALNGGLVTGMIALGVGIAATAVLIPFTDFTKKRVEVQAGLTGGSISVSF